MPSFDELSDSKSDSPHALEGSSISGHENIDNIDESIGNTQLKSSAAQQIVDDDTEIDEFVEDSRRLFCGMLSKHYTESTLSSVSIYPISFFLFCIGLQNHHLISDLDSVEHNDVMKVECSMDALYITKQ